MVLICVFFLGRYSAPTLTAVQFRKLIIELGLIGGVGGGHLKDVFRAGRWTSIRTGEYSAGKNVVGIICGSLIRKMSANLSAVHWYW